MGLEVIVTDRRDGQKRCHRNARAVEVTPFEIVVTNADHSQAYYPVQYFSAIISKILEAQ